MIDGNIVKMLARQVPNYHLVAQATARRSLSLCPCMRCKRAVRACEGGGLLCMRVLGKCGDDGYAIVAANGTCDRAEFRRDGAVDLVLMQETAGGERDEDGQAQENHS